MDFLRYTFPSRRSNVIARHGMVATSQPLASQAGLAVLQAGGNAVDAAIATVATLCVVEPCSTGVGGDAFALLWSAEEQRLYGLNASGPAPAALSSDWIRSQGYETMPAMGPIPVTVPGGLRGWEQALRRFGTWPLSRLLRQPIGYAGNGFPVSEKIARSWAQSTEKMSQHRDSRRVWLPGGRAPRAGELFCNPEFAATLETIGGDGVEAFYLGEIGGQIAATVQEAGGVLTQQDLAAYEPEWVEPLAVPYRDGFTFHEIPPNGQGLTALLALNIVRDFDMPALAYDSAARVHLQLEAIKLAFADAAAYIGDPRQTDIPIKELLGDRYSERRRALIREDRALDPQPGNPHDLGDTVYLTVADEAGNMVSWIQSLYTGFGSGLTAGNTGVQLQNRGANFTLEPGHPNEAAPGRRPYNTIIPGFITREGHAWASFGVMGGFMQPQGHLQVGSNLIDYRMDPQSALDAPRFQWQRAKEVALEDGFGEAIRGKLAARGHHLRAEGYYGGGQVIVRDSESGVLVAGSEPRNDGAAAGW
jgi:gamma-glutamyltranspeptidase / glutathione hydrolase